MKKYLTSWFSPEIKPVHIGMYQIMFWNTDEVHWCYWNGERWGFAYKVFSWAYRKKWREDIDASQNKYWRGLVKKPKGVKE